jgi:hypothetical protein
MEIIYHKKTNRVEVSAVFRRSGEELVSKTLKS